MDSIGKFIECCKNGKLFEAQTLLANNKIDIHDYNECAFRVSCNNGHLDVAKWLLSLESVHGKIDIHAINDCTLRWSCCSNRLDVVKWLLSLDKFNNDLVDHYLPGQLYEYAFDLGYLPVKYMTPSYAQYKAKILEQIKEKNTGGKITVFEVKGLPELICAYV
jgi:hypothetical protein